jgi:hypothetical protein
LWLPTSAPTAAHLTPRFINQGRFSPVLTPVAHLSAWINDR